MLVRQALTDELDQLARIWYDSWRDAHAAILPAELTRHRTLASFRTRLAQALPDTRVAGEPGDPLGFCIIQEDELYQLFVSAAARGTGVARALVDDAEGRLAARGVEVAWLACAIGNERAAAFYRKCGWRPAGSVISQLETPDGLFPLEVWRFEKRLGPPVDPLRG